MQPRPWRKRRGFTLLELLASVVLLVILGAMLFEVFARSSEVVRLGNSRVEIYQYARALFDSLDRELQGAIQDNSADKSQAIHRFRVYHGQDPFSEPMRSGSDAVEFSAGLIGRDTIENSETYGQTANAATVAYWLSPDDFILNRYESYELKQNQKGRGWEFALNVLDFQISCLNQWSDPPAFERMGWDSLEEVNPRVRRGLPMAVRVKVRMTDERHLSMYEMGGGEMKMKEDFSAEDDPMAQTFVEVISMGSEH